MQQYTNGAIRVRVKPCGPQDDAIRQCSLQRESRQILGTSTKEPAPGSSRKDANREGPQGKNTGGWWRPASGGGGSGFRAHWRRALASIIATSPKSASFATHAPGCPAGIAQRLPSPRGPDQGLRVHGFSDFRSSTLNPKALLELTEGGAELRMGYVSE